MSNKPNTELLNDENVQEALADSLREMTNICHGIAREGGWWDRKGDAKAAHELLESGAELDEQTQALLRRVADQERNPLELLALVHSEVSEALEGVRKDQMDDKLPHRKMEEVELADVIVRILDYAGGRGLDVGGALVEKLIFNTTRADHKPENRALAGGKKY